MAIQCYACHRPQSYPFAKIPLGPPEIKRTSINEDGIEIRKAIVPYGWFCVPCGQIQIGSLSEEFLSKPTGAKEDV